MSAFGAKRTFASRIWCNKLGPQARSKSALSTFGAFARSIRRRCFRRTHELHDQSRGRTEINRPNNWNSDDPARELVERTVATRIKDAHTHLISQMTNICKSDEAGAANDNLRPTLFAILPICLPLGAWDEPSASRTFDRACRNTQSALNQWQAF